MFNRPKARAFSVVKCHPSCWRPSQSPKLCRPAIPALNLQTGRELICRNPESYTLKKPKKKQWFLLLSWMGDQLVIFHQEEIQSLFFREAPGYPTQIEPATIRIGWLVGIRLSNDIGSNARFTIAPSGYVVSARNKFKHGHEASPSTVSRVPSHPYFDLYHLRSTCIFQVTVVSTRQYL